MDQLDKKLNVTTKRYVCINCTVYIRSRNYEVATLYPGFFARLFFDIYLACAAVCVPHALWRTQDSLRESVLSRTHAEATETPLAGRGEDEGK